MSDEQFDVLMRALVAIRLNLALMLIVVVASMLCLVTIATRLQ